MSRSRNLLLLMIFSAACRPEELLGQAENDWLWAVAPFLGFLFVGGSLVYLGRDRQLASWNLRPDPREPSANGILGLMVVAWIGFGIAFTVLNFRFEIDPGQVLWNIVHWLVGSVVGALLGLLGGLRFAEPRPYELEAGQEEV